MKSEDLTRDKLIEMLLEDQRRHPEDKPILSRDEVDDLYARDKYVLERCRKPKEDWHWPHSWLEDKYFNNQSSINESGYGPPVDVIIF